MRKIVEIWNKIKGSSLLIKIMDFIELSNPSNYIGYN